MLKSRMMFGLIAVVMVLTLAQSGYAQLSISVTGNPSPRETATNKTAETNDPTVDTGMVITGTVLSDAPITGARLRITYPSVVTNNTVFPATDPIQVAFASGIFAGATVAAVSNTNGRVDIRMPCLAGVITNQTGTIILTGVRIDASALAAAPAQAAISTTTGSGIADDGPGGNPSICPSGVSLTATNVTLNTAAVDVISTLPAGIGSVANGGMPSSVSSGDVIAVTGVGTCNGDAAHQDCGVATVYTNRNTPDQEATFTVSEGSRTAWFDSTNTAQFAGARGFLNDGGFRLTFNGLPAGVTLTLAVAAYTKSDAPYDNPLPVVSRTAITTANNTANVSFTNPVPTGSTVDRVTFKITGITVSSTATLTPGTVTVTATMFPTGDALDTSTDTAAIITSTFPRYSDSQVGTATVVSIVPANTTLLIPFAVVAGAYDTGIALANTSADPFGTATGGAIPQTGTVRVDLFPSNATGAGTSSNFTTSATKRAGSGIAADGTIPAGATWTVNLSELLPLAGVTAPFTGYVFVQANFLFAHGAAYVYDGRGFTSATPVLVMPPPSISGRTGINGSTAEILSY